MAITTQLRMLGRPEIGTDEVALPVHSDKAWTVQHTGYTPASEETTATLVVSVVTPIGTVGRAEAAEMITLGPGQFVTVPAGHSTIYLKSGSGSISVNVAASNRLMGEH